MNMWEEDERGSGIARERTSERRRDRTEAGIVMVGGWRDTVNRWEAINFGLECPIAPHFVQCKFTPDANRHLARSSFSSGARTPTGKRM